MKLLPSWPERGATMILEGAGRRMWGFPPRLMAPIVARLGPLYALGWFAWHLPRYQRTRAVFGAVRTNLLTLAISLVNGCGYCAYGHGYALELAYLHEHGRLFPLTEDDMLRLIGQPPAQVRHRLIDATRHAGLLTDLSWLDRAIELALTADPRGTEPDDARLAHLARMFAVLNAVGIADGTQPDQAHDPINKDHELKGHYARLRATARR